MKRLLGFYMVFKEGDIYLDLQSDTLIKIEVLLDTQTYKASIRALGSNIWFKPISTYRLFYLQEELNKGNCLKWDNTTKILYGP